MRVMAKGSRRRKTAQRGALSMVDVLVIAFLLTILLVAARQEFPGLRDRATPVAPPAKQALPPG
jgi:hypothetical protein